MCIWNVIFRKHTWPIAVRNVNRFNDTSHLMRPSFDDSGKLFLIKSCPRLPVVWGFQKNVAHTSRLSPSASIKSFDSDRIYARMRTSVHTCVRHAFRNGLIKTPTFSLIRAWITSRYTPVVLLPTFHFKSHVQGSKYELREFKNQAYVAVYNARKLRKKFEKFFFQEATSLYLRILYIENSFFSFLRVINIIKKLIFRNYFKPN